MVILIPVDSNDGLNAKIVKQSDMQMWALVTFADGKAANIEFCKDRTECSVEWIDFVVLDNKFENYMDFMNEGMMCLVKREEQTVEEIVSAFAFKELDEMGL
jgi:predicted Fe-Mo cluster-binding NifX family protein